jgi:hypothetical protein
MTAVPVALLAVIRWPLDVDDVHVVRRRVDRVLDAVLLAQELRHDLLELVGVLLVDEDLDDDDSGGESESEDDEDFSPPAKNKRPQKKPDFDFDDDDLED